MTSEQAAVFFLTCIGFGFIPGPALLQTVSLTMRHGRRAGFLSALGIHLGAMCQIAIVALGAVAVLKASPMLYQSLRVASGAYLVWLGILRIRSSADVVGALALPKNVVSSSALIEAANPKSALFHFSFLVQFADPGRSLALGWQLFLLGVCANLLFSLSDIVCILLADPVLARATKGRRALKYGQWATGLLFIGLGIAAIVGQ